MCQHRTHHIGVALGLDEAQQRMQGAVGVPQREDRIVLKASGLVHGAVYATIAPVDVGVDRGVDHRVIE